MCHVGRGGRGACASPVESGALARGRHRAALSNWFSVSVDERGVLLGGNGSSERAGDERGLEEGPPLPTREGCGGAGVLQMECPRAGREPRGPGCAVRGMRWVPGLAWEVQRLQGRVGAPGRWEGTSFRGGLHREERPGGFRAIRMAGGGLGSHSWPARCRPRAAGWLAEASGLGSGLQMLGPATPNTDIVASAFGGRLWGQRQTDHRPCSQGAQSQGWAHRQSMLRAWVGWERVEGDSGCGRRPDSGC